jgi:hypothetical protein
MNQGRTVFAQLMDYLPIRRFQAIVERHRGDRKVTRFHCLDQFYCMAFAQLTWRESLRDIEACLQAQPSKLYHLGIRARQVRRSTLADANEQRDWRIFAELAQLLIQEARALYADESIGIDLDEPVYAFDSTTVELCLALFPWARFRRHKGAIKLHTLLDIRGSIPSFIWLSTGKVHDVHGLDHLIFEPGSFYLFDRGYLDFQRLYRIHTSGAFFVTRAKRNMQFRVVASRPVDKSTGLRCDQTIVLTGLHSPQDYPDRLRRIRFVDPESGQGYVFLSNNHTLPVLHIPHLYKMRWRVELFFKWIKQHLRIKAFYGTSANAVLVQVWTAISVFVIVALLRKRLRIEMDMYRILQILSLHVFEKVPIHQLLTETKPQTVEDANCNQLTLFNL